MVLGRTVLVVAIAVATSLIAACSSSSSNSAPAAVGHKANPAASPTATAKQTRSVRLAAVAVTARLKQYVHTLGRVEVLTAADDQDHLLGRPNGYTSKTIFADTRVTGQSLADGVPAGGECEVWPSRAAADARATYIQKILAADPGLGSEYDYVSQGILLRVSGLLTPAQAKVYEQALGKITGAPVALVK